MSSGATVAAETATPPRTEGVVEPTRAFDAAAAALILLAVCALFASPLATPDALLFGKDLEGEQFNFESYIRHSLAQGQIPWWNPYNASGSPFVADPMTGLFYPPNALLRWLPLYGFFVAVYVLHFWLAGLGVYVLCRSLGVGGGPSLAAALGVALSTPMTQLIYLGHAAVIYSFAWVPWALWLAMRSARRSGWLPHPGLVAVMMMQLMAGFPQIGAYTFGVIALYYVYSFAWPPRLDRACGRYQPLAQFGVLLLLFVGVGAFQLLPTLRLVLEAGRAEGVSWDYATKGSLPLTHLATLVFPAAIDPIRDGYVPYVGWLLLALAPFSLASKRHRRTALFLTLTGTGALALAIARDLPFFALAYSITGIFRVPMRLLFFWSLAVGVLGAVGLETLLRRAGSRGRTARIAVFWLIGVALVMTLLMLVAPREGATQSLAYGGPAWIPWAQILGCLALALGVHTGRQRRAVAAMVAGLVLVALLPVGQEAVTVRKPERYPEIAEALTGMQVGRVIDLCRDAIPVNRYMDLRVATTDGYNSLFLGDYARFVSVVKGQPSQGPPESLGSLHGAGRLPPRVDLLRLMNVTHVLACQPLDDPRLTLVRTSERHGADGWIDMHVYEIERTLPRAFMPCGPIVRANRERAVELLVDPASISRVSTWVAAAGGSTEVVETSAAAGHTLVVPPPRCDVAEQGARVEVRSKDTPTGELTLDVIAPRSGLLYLSEVYYPERRAWVDGARVPVQRANLAFSAIRVPQGRHEIVLRYVPRLFSAGLIVSAATLLLWLGTARVVIRRQSTISWSGSPAPIWELTFPRALVVRAASLMLLCGGLAWLGCGAFLWATAPETRTIHVRWIVTASHEERASAERRLGLRPSDLIDVRTGIYHGVGWDPAELEAIVRHELVEDTHGFDRETYRFPSSRFPARALPFGLWAGLIAVHVVIVRGVDRGRATASGRGP